MEAVSLDKNDSGSKDGQMDEKFSTDVKLINDCFNKFRT